MSRSPKDSTRIGYIGNSPVSIITAAETHTELVYNKNIIKNRGPRPPVPMTRISPQALFTKLKTERGMLEQAEVTRRTRAFLTEEHFVSTTPLSRLEPICLQQMMLNKRHMGSYLLCRVAAPAYSIGSIRIGIEDQNGWVFLVDLSNFPYADRMSNTELDTVFALNTVVAIREPYPRQADVGDHCDLPIQSPSDFVFLGPDDPLVAGISWKTNSKPFPQLGRTDEEWKALGNQHFKAEQYFAAIVAYTFGLRRNPEFVALRLNRALANLRLGRFDPAFADCKKVIDEVQIDKESKLKAVYRAAQAVYGQGDYHTARNWYTRCFEVDSSFQDANLGIKKCEQRIKEKETGDYDWVHLWEHGLVPGIELDVADYKGPIQIAAVENRGGGRGIIASRDIKIGELLLVSKAFVAVNREQYQPGQLFHQHEDPPCEHEERLDMHSHALYKALAKIYSAPHLASQVLDLYAGEEFSKAEPMLPNSTDLGSQDDPLAFSFDADISRIEKILHINCIPTSLDPDVVRDDLPTGLFILPAYFNHSCVPNTSCTVHGDVVVLRAAEDIPRGKEITSRYLWDSSYAKRKAALLLHFEECDCALCEADRADGMEQCLKRDQLIERAERRREISVSAARTLVEEMEKTYINPRSTISPGLAYAYRQLFFSAENNPRKAGDDCLLAIVHNLEASGVVVIDRSLEEAPNNATSMPIAATSLPRFPLESSLLCILNAIFFGVMKKPRKARMWVQASVWIEDTACGGGIQLYKARHKELTPDIMRILNELETTGPWGILPVD